MKYRVTIPGQLKGLNELLAGRFRNPRTGIYHNKVKTENDKVCCYYIHKCLGKTRIDNTIRCTFFIYAPNKKKDRGNIYCAVEKSFLDALQETGVLRNDAWDYVLDSEFHTFLDRDNPRIEVLIEEVENYKRR